MAEQFVSAIQRRAAVRLGDLSVILRRKIGEGGNSLVFEVFASPSINSAALKVLKRPRADHRHKLDRFRREVKALQHLDTKFVVRVLAVGDVTANGVTVPAFLMELADCSLRKLIDVLWKHSPGASAPSEPPIPRSVIADILLDVVDGLEAIHNAGLVHRDLKPENILIRRDWTACIADLGLVLDATVPPLTVTGEVVANRDYWAPEQRYSQSVDRRADYFSLGMVLLEVLTGKLPRGNLDNESAAQLLLPIPALSFEANRLMMADPDRRPRALSALREALCQVTSCDRVQRDLRRLPWWPAAPSDWRLTVRCYNSINVNAQRARSAIRVVQARSPFARALLERLYRRGHLEVLRHEGLDPHVRESDELQKLAREHSETDFKRAIETLLSRHVLTWTNWGDGDGWSEGYKLTPEASQILRAADAGIDVNPALVLPSVYAPAPDTLYESTLSKTRRMRN